MSLTEVKSTSARLPIVKDLVFYEASFFFEWTFFLEIEVHVHSSYQNNRTVDISVAINY